MNFRCKCMQTGLAPSSYSRLRNLAFVPSSCSRWIKANADRRDLPADLVGRCHTSSSILHVLFTVCNNTELKVSTPWNHSFGASRFLRFFYSPWFLFYIYTPNIGFQNMFIEMVNSMTNACKIASNYSHGESWSLWIEFISLHKNKKNKILKDIVWGKNKLIQGPLLTSDVFLRFPP